MMRGFVLMSVFLLLLLLPERIQASFEYAAACVPKARNDYSYVCQLFILGESSSDIEIHMYNGTNTFTLPAGTPYKGTFGEEFYPDIGVESKAIRVVSSVEVQVLMHQLRTSGNYQDAYMVPNNLLNNSTYFTSGYKGGCIGSVKHFYLVTSLYDETEIHVTQQDGVTYDVLLPVFGTFVQKTNDSNEHLASGTKITASKPINVVSGNLCTFNYVGGSASGATYFSSILDVASLGEEYIVPPITSDDFDSTGGYTVDVVATANETLVLLDEESFELNEGESTLVHYPYKKNCTRILCNRPCLVVQYSKSNTNDASYGNFMQTILPDQQFSTSAFFTTLDTHPTSYLSLVVKGEAAGYDIHLNGTSLGYLNWSPVSGYSSAELAIPQGSQELLSMDGRPFAAYTYTHLNRSNSAAGYAFLPSGSSDVTPLPTSTPAAPTATSPTSTATPPTSTATTPSPLNGTFPQHVVRVNGTAVTADGEAMSPQCAVAHQQNLNAKGKDMIVRVNDAIGNSICMMAADLLVVSSAATMFHIENKSFLEMDQVLRVLGHHVVDDVETCALEVAEYLNDLSHWQHPIFPAVPDCSSLEAQPPYFNTSDTFWSCNNQGNKDNPSTLSTLSYESMVSELLETADGGSLDAGCTRAYSDEAGKKGSDMMKEISTALAVSGCSNVTTTATYIYSFVALQNQGSFYASFYYLPSRSSTFAEIVECMQQVHNFTLQHDNWSPGSQPGAPFLPVPPGCPALEHDTNTLDDAGHRWVCA